MSFDKTVMNAKSGDSIELIYTPGTEDLANLANGCVLVITVKVEDVSDKFAWIRTSNMELRRSKK